MPSHDLTPRLRSIERLRIAQQRAAFGALARRLRKRPGRKPGDSGGEAVPVEPNRPNTLSGGAAAALEFSSDD